MNPQEQHTDDGKKVNIKAVDMAEEIQQVAVDTAKVALSKHTVLREIAGHVKKRFDELYGPTWHCVVGKSFGSYVTHQTHKFIFFYVDDMAFMIFQTA